MKNSRVFGPLLASTAALFCAVVGCAKSSSQDSHRAVPIEAGGGGKPLPPPGTRAFFYKFGPPDSKIEFIGAKVTGKHEGSFGSFEGTIGLVNEDPTMSAVQVTIDLASLAITPPKLATHLKGADFFDVAKHPKATFSSTNIRPSSETSKYNVTGRLELHGVNKPLTFPATIRSKPESVEAQAEITINRKDWGIVYPGMPDDLISDDVVLKLSVVAHPKSAQTTNEGGAPADAPGAD